MRWRNCVFRIILYDTINNTKTSAVISCLTQTHTQIGRSLEKPPKKKLAYKCTHCGFACVVCVTNCGLLTLFIRYDVLILLLYVCLAQAPRYYVCAWMDMFWVSIIKSLSCSGLRKSQANECVLVRNAAACCFKIHFRTLFFYITFVMVLFSLLFPCSNIGFGTVSNEKFE